VRRLAVRGQGRHRLSDRVARDGVKCAFAQRVEPRLEALDLAGQVRALANMVQVHLLHPLVGTAGRPP
jgi:hypothetical protein